MKSKVITGCNMGVCVLCAIHAAVHQSPDVCIWFAIGALSCTVYAFLPRAVAQCTDRADCLLLKTFCFILSAICFLIGLSDLCLQETLAKEFTVLGLTLLAAGDSVRKSD